MANFGFSFADIIKCCRKASLLQKVLQYFLSVLLTTRGYPTTLWLTASPVWVVLIKCSKNRYKILRTYMMTGNDGTTRRRVCLSTKRRVILPVWWRAPSVKPLDDKSTKARIPRRQHRHPRDDVMSVSVFVSVSASWNASLKDGSHRANWIEQDAVKPYVDSTGGNTIASVRIFVRPFVYTSTFEPIELKPCVWVISTALVGLKAKIRGQG